MYLNIMVVRYSLQNNCQIKMDGIRWYPAIIHRDSPNNNTTTQKDLIKNHHRKLEVSQRNLMKPLFKLC